MNESYWFTWDDTPAPYPVPGLYGGRSRLILQINGRMGQSLYKTVCFLPTSDKAKAMADTLNKSPDLVEFVRVLERAIGMMSTTKED